MKYLVLVFLLVGCTGKPHEERLVDSYLCSIECVESMTYRLDEISGTAVNDFMEICTKKFEKVTCCTTSQPSYYSDCREQYKIYK